MRAQSCAKYDRRSKSIGVDVSLEPFQGETMPVFLVVLLAVFWMFLSFRAFEGGDAPMGVLFLVIGVALTMYRLRGRAQK
jgi:hypothetical protein